eukprot:SAG22_NODE_10800_length_518_cov_1.413462_1_plen_124_part_01
MAAAASPCGQSMDTWGYIVVIDKHGEDRDRLELFDDEPYTFGRHMDSDIKINLATVSRRHAEIFRIGEKVWLRNIQEANETELSGSKIKGRVEVTEGATIGIHGRFFRFEYAETGDDEEESEPT